MLRFNGAPDAVKQRGTGEKAMKQSQNNKPKTLRGRPFEKGQSGNPNGRPRGDIILKWAGMENNPVNMQETEVRERFRILNELYGWFKIVHSQEGFPDFVLKDRDGNIIRAEAEVRSGTFKNHGHDVDECDLIICWSHTWSDCPLPVFVVSVEWINYKQLKRVRPYLIKAQP